MSRKFLSFTTRIQDPNVSPDGVKVVGGFIEAKKVKGVVGTNYGGNNSFIYVFDGHPIYALETSEELQKRLEALGYKFV